MEDSYRASVAGIVVNYDFEFLMVQLDSAREDEWDFVKGGIKKGEMPDEALIREIKEELGDEIDFEILQKCEWSLVYDWPEKLQIEKGFREQARVNYWTLYNGGEICINKNELRCYNWFSESEIGEFLKSSGFPEYEIENFERCLLNFKKLWKLS